jgi:hypothetical protein
MGRPYDESERTMNHLDNIDKPYIPAAKTNILETLRKLGWTPPSQDKRFIEKWQTYKHLAWRNEQ